MNIDENSIHKTIKFLKENIKPHLIYIFGSSVNGIFREDSDIDIAFKSEHELTPYQVFMFSQSLADILGRDVDLIDLNKASTVFKVQIIANGKCVYCSDDVKKAYFEMYAYKDYAKLNEEREVILNNIKKRGQIYE
ncbi:type VII toxin-antitoxin system MntA family adenylyltransferase antitoxin [Clostridium tyrobutyricum]|uniref:type VII toxin-antitoxin system MntA family adenylyltransferase antitoxin n=1 Tax=Clostridium tyrobutyricum TaxID=1519 RepID=UPI0003179F56|nr:nucleotidyltransferase domain-containing protein [Clostridium tyrobutyricum]MBV4425489.1 nucleotidyltransferase domain-containing protein [Clostridium tyrobutyricum]MBV4438464.1 nucleotidyltransferase domain-containing protein [Clostridium tyrobutyricum]MEA5007092.1 nucleotidyltransferase domain-containing protein [Clostridium tyrobutyricum]